MFKHTAATSAFPTGSARSSSTHLTYGSLCAAGIAAAGLLLLSANLPAQQTATPPTAPLVLLAAASVPGAGETLPDAPQPSNPSVQSAFSSSTVAATLAGGYDTVKGAKMAGPYTKYIEPDESAPRLTARDKVILGLKDAVSPFSMTAWLASSAYEQVFNNSPNYGQDGVGFAKRLGAGALRDITEGAFGDSALAPLLHEDPRFYRMGKGHPFLKRVVYAGSRGLITRTDSGHSTVNIANIGGNLGGSLLTDTYYPARNTTFSETMETFGTGVGGSALGFAVSEFLPDVFHVFHLPAPGY